MIAGISLVKDEADIIEQTVSHMLGQVDQVIVADNGSTDGTREILATLPVTLIDDPDPAHNQSQKLTAIARESGADWVVPFDGDELWFSHAGRIADVIPREAWILTAQLFEHVPTQMGGDPISRMGWRKRDPLPLLKVACRVDPQLTIAEGNHSCHYAGDYPPTVAGLLEVRHYPYRSPDQFVSKVRKSYAGRKLTDWQEGQSVHVREFGEVLDERGEDGLVDYFFKHFYRPNPELLVHDPWPPR